MMDSEVNDGAETFVQTVRVQFSRSLLGRTRIQIQSTFFNFEMTQIVFKTGECVASNCG
jgi:hypothetical protein